MSESSQFGYDSVFGGSMSADEFMETEFHVDMEHERFTLEGVPYIDVTFDGVRRRLHPFNTTVIRYSQDGPTQFDHILHQGEKPLFVFYTENKMMQMLAEKLLERDFPLLLHYGRPHPNVTENLYTHWRGDMPLHEVIELILEDE